jgi:WD40 repeat protein
VSRLTGNSSYLFGTTPNSPQAWKTAKWEELPNPPDFVRLGIACTSIAPNERQWASGHQDGTIRLWTFPANEQLAQFLAHAGGVSGVAFSPGGDLLASAGNDGYVHLFNVPTRRHLGSFRAHYNSARAVCFSPDGRRVATGEGVAKLWDLATGRTLISLKGEGRDLRLGFSPDGNTLVGLERESEIVHLWHAPSFAELEAAERSHAPPGPQP